MKTFMTQNQQEEQPFTEANFVAIYGEYVLDNEDLKKMPFPVTLNFALDMEAEHCEVPPSQRTDETKRLRKLAEYIGPTALLPEHLHLLEG